MVSDVHQNTAPKDNVKETSVQFLGDARSDSDTTAAGPTALTMAGTPIVRRKRRASSSEETTRDYASPSPDAQRPSTKQQVRHRASVACASCRERRIRCVVPEGQAECTQCSRTGISCIIKNDDERRRPISKAYMSSLSNRIAMLEGMLKEKGVDPPPAVHPPKTRQEAQEKREEEQNSETKMSDQSCNSDRQSSTERQALTPPSSVDDDVDMVALKQEDNSISMGETARLCLVGPALLQEFEPRQESDVRRLLCSKGRLSYDQSAARVRFFGPTANVHVYAESSCQFDPREPPEQARRAERIIRALSPVTHDHLMSRFWQYFNTTHQLVDQATFEADRVSEDPKFYSLFLHIAMLAAGYRFADKGREDVRRLALGSWESILQKEAKAMLEMELERPGEVPSVQALIILADLECGVGRDTQGWIFSGMANRLAFDVGLHVDLGGAMSETERRVRRQVMAACAMLDRQFATFLGRPTSIKSQDIGIDLAPKDLSHLSLETAMFAMPGFASKPALLNDSVIHYQLMELMELASRISDAHNAQQNALDASSMSGIEGTQYMQTVAMDRQLQNWYRRLPGYLTWNPANVKVAPLSFFLLHQTFHVCMILLHRPWAKYGPVSSGELVDHGFGPGLGPASLHSDEANAFAPFSQAFGTPQPASDDNKVVLARSMCTQHAIRVARIFWQHRQRHDGKKISLMAVQHAGTAALALMGALAHQSKELDHQSNLRYLQVLSSAIYDMSQIYHPAARMYHLLKSMLVDIRREIVSSRSLDTDHSRSLDPDAFLRQIGQGLLYQSSCSWATNPTNLHPVLPNVQEGPEAAPSQPVKRRRLSERLESELELPAPPLFGKVYTYPSPPTSSQSVRALSAEKQESTSSGGLSLEEEALDFDFDFLESSVDFDGPQEETIEVTVAEGVPENNNAATSPSESRVAAEPPCGSADVLKETEPKLRGPEDDQIADMTIEEWLAEPRVITPPLPECQLPRAAGGMDRQNLGGASATDGIASAGSADAVGPSGDGIAGMPWLVDEEQADMGLNELVESMEEAKRKQEKEPVRNLDLDFLRL